MATKWTKEQREVIDSRGSNLLVAAAAGSGKTAVMIERIIQLVIDKKKAYRYRQVIGRYIY